METLTELYNDLLKLGVTAFSGSYHLSGSCDSVVIQTANSCGLFLDIDRIRTHQQELEAVSHEWAHITTGSTYTLDSARDIRAKAETRATRAQIKRLMPFCELSAAVRGGLREPWQLAEQFDVSEDFVRQAVDYYTGPCGLTL